MGIFDRLRTALHVATAPTLSPMSMTPSEHYGSDNGRSSGGFLLNGGKYPGALSTLTGHHHLDYDALRNRSRMAKWDSTQAEAIVGRLVDNIIGTGLSIQAAPIWELIEPKADQSDSEISERRHKAKRDIEVRHNLYLNSTEPDATGTRSGYNLQKFEAEALFWDGELFKVSRYSADPGRMSPLYHQYYSPEQVCNPGSVDIAAAKARGNTVHCGIELTKDGREVAIFVTEDPMKPVATIRIPFFDETPGVKNPRRFVSHPKLTDKPGQVRGVPLLANVLHQLTKITDAEVAEIEAMVLNALYAVWLKPSDKAPSGPPQGMGKASVGGSTNPGQSTRTDESGNTTFLKPGIMFPRIKAGESLESFDTKRPNLNVVAFNDMIMTGIAASKGLSVEMMKLQYNTSFVAARAAVQATWVKVEMWRDQIDVQSIGQDYRSWFIEEVNARRIKAPGFGKSPVLTEAWLNHKLLGASMPVLNPVQEVSAIKMRTELGHTTGEREAMVFNGSDYTENVARQKVENYELAEARAPLDAPKPAQLALPFDNSQDNKPSADPKSPNYEPKMDPNSPEFDPNYDPEVD